MLLVAEVISPRSGSEQVDRVRKVREYNRAGIPLYWIVDLEPEAKITIPTLRGEEYALDVEIRAGHMLMASKPFPVSFDPSRPHRARVRRVDQTIPSDMQAGSAW
ncbi:MAG: Uma2 family endonuclease [Streptosporangiaceae bacterium]